LDAHLHNFRTVPNPRSGRDWRERGGGRLQLLVHRSQLPPDQDAGRGHSDEERVYHVHQVKRHAATRLREQPERAAEFSDRLY